MDQPERKCGQGGETQNPLDEYVANAIKCGPIVLFSKTWCPYCTRVKKVLEDYKVKYQLIELDDMPSNFGRAVQGRLKALTGQATVPSLFVNGKHIGGCSTIENLDACGFLGNILSGDQNTANTYNYDVIIMGGGSGGLAAAKEAARNGKSVCVCDYVAPSIQGSTWGLGGTCTNVGCIPKKLMHRAALIKRDVLDAPSFGWNIDVSSLKHDWKELVSNIQDHIKTLNWRNRKDLTALGVTYFNAKASFVDEHTVKLEFQDEKSSKNVTGRNIVIAVGGRPKYLDIPGTELCITSDDLFSLDQFPQKILIIGASYVGLEVASFLKSLGSEVFVMVRSVLLRGKEFDREVINRLKTEMEKQGVTFLLGCTPVKIYGNERALRVDAILEDGTQYTSTYTTVMLAVGREPKTDTLNLEAAGVKVCDNGKIWTTPNDRTSVKHIFAVGDCNNNRPELTPTAVLAGKVIGRLLSIMDVPELNYINIPKTVFTSPEYGCCGESEESAQETFGCCAITVHHALYRTLEKTLTQPTQKAFAKVITIHEGTNCDRIVGVHFLGPNAGEVIQGFALAVKLRATKQDLDVLVGIHPTCAQVMTMLVPRDGDKPVEEQESGC